MEYPKVFEQCPICHSSERVLEAEVNEEKRKGKIPQDRIATSQMTMLPVVDPISMTGLSAPVLTVFKDICGGCGFEYPHVITKQILPRHQIEQLLGYQKIQRKMG